jgi:hypothetical protein
MDSRGLRPIFLGLHDYELGQCRKLIHNRSVSVWRKWLTILKNKMSGSFHMRAVRIRIFSAHNISFDLFSSSARKRLNVTNVSTTGIGFSKDEDSSWQALGQKLTGQLNLRNSSFRVSLEVRHVTQGTVGCKFISTETSLEKAIEDYLVYEITALGLKSVDKEHLATTEEGEPHWFIDPKGNELYVIEKNNELLRFHIVFLGNYVEWKKGNLVKVGIVLSDRNAKPLRHKGSHVVRFSDSVPKEISVVVGRLLENIPQLNLEIKSQIQAAFEK